MKMTLICKIMKTILKNNLCTIIITVNNLQTLNFKAKWALKIRTWTRRITFRLRTLQTIWATHKPTIRCSSRTKWWIHMPTQITKWGCATTAVTGRQLDKGLRRSTRSRWWGHHRILAEPIANTSLQVTYPHLCNWKMPVSSSRCGSKKPT